MTKEEKLIEYARLRQCWIAHEYGVKESSIVWMGSNAFLVVKNGESFKVYA